MKLSNILLLGFILSFWTPSAYSSNMCANLFKNPSEKYSEITKKHGFDFLQHYTTFNNLLEILSSKKMELPRNLPPEKIRSYNYTPDLIMFFLSSKDSIPENAYNNGMSLVGSKSTDTIRENSIFTNLDKVYLRFSPEIMNKGTFHITKNIMGYGSFDANTDFKTPRSVEKLEEFYSEGRIGEVGFYESIPTSYILEIWISSVRRNELIAKLHSLNIFDINGKAIEDIIKTPPTSNYNYRRVQDLKSSEFDLTRIENLGFEWVMIPKQ